MFRHLSIIGLVAFSSAAFAQTSAQPPQIPNGGNFTFIATPTSRPSSLLDLIRQSSLIVDGTVGTVLPAINSSASNTGPNIETHSVLAVNTVLKGAVPNHSANILLAQAGGAVGNWNVSVQGDPLVAPGERYILFLVPDDRKDMPNSSGMPRYAVIGISIGKVKVTNGSVQFAASASSELHSNDGDSVADFLQTVSGIIARPYTNSSLPINLAPKP